ncbi:MAG: DMT family transporter [Methanolobus sp.]|uniref:DMT family transporter n=1 Tax=Methanolobus sp. TaxID=1874737 RepID=UPI0027322160|nr:DMT family transporter [Methanolobus sp.]MDP2217013.1 DMT family transporter [Methanolobus sp.]
MSTAPKKAYMELVAGSVLFGMLGLFVDRLEAVPTLSLIFYKQFFGVLSLLVFIVIAGKISLLMPRRKKKYLLLLGIINTATLLTYFVCIRYTSFSVAILLLYTAPMYVTLLSPVTPKEPITRKGMVALALSLTGLLFIVDLQAALDGFSNGGEYLLGMTAGILSGFIFGCEIILIRYLKDDYSSVAQLFWYTLIGVVLLFPFGAKLSQPVLLDNLGMLVFFGVINTALAALLYVSGISQIKAQIGSILALIEPVSGIFFDYTILHTPLYVSTIIGCVFILLGATVAVLEKSHRKFGKLFRLQV